MEVYKAEAREIIRRFVERQITHQQCVAALDIALAGVFPRLTVADLATIQAEHDTNYQKIEAELKRRMPLPSLTN